MLSFFMIENQFLRLKIYFIWEKIIFFLQYPFYFTVNGITGPSSLRQNPVHETKNKHTSRFANNNYQFSHIVYKIAFRIHFR